MQALLGDLDVAPGLPHDQVVEQGVVERLPGVAQRPASPHRRTPDSAVVIVLRDRHAFLGQHLAEQLEVDRLVVHQHAVEVEDHRSNHGFSLAVASGEWRVASH